MNRKQQKILGLVCAAVIMFLLIPQTGALLKNPLQSRALSSSEEYLNSGLKRAAASYALARGLNGIISLVQESQIQATIMGAGASIAAGQLLDPVNDLVERFSWLMLMALISFGVQRIVLELVTWLGFNVLLAGAFILMLLSFIFIKKYLLRLGIYLLCLFAAVVLFVPASSWISQGVYGHFLDPTYQSSVRDLSEYKDKLEPQNKGEKQTGFWDRLKGLDFPARINQFQDMAENMIQDLVNLMVVFTVQTVILPLVFLWLFIRMIKLVGIRTQSPLIEHRVVDRTLNASA